MSLYNCKSYYQVFFCKASSEFSKYLNFYYSVNIKEVFTEAYYYFFYKVAVINS